MAKRNDEIREAILKFLYEKHKKARSLKSARASMKELKDELKKLGLKEQEIVSNLDYLIQSRCSCRCRRVGIQNAKRIHEKNRERSITEYQISELTISRAHLNSKELKNQLLA